MIRNKGVVIAWSIVIRETTLRIRGIEGDISNPNGSAGMRRSARKQRGISDAGFGVDEGGSGAHGAR